MKRSGILLALALLVVGLVATVGCGKSPVSPTHIAIVFTADAYTVPVGSATVLHYKVVDEAGTEVKMSGCYIEPTYHDIACSGSLTVPFPLAGTYPFTFHVSTLAQTLVIQAK